MTTITTLILDLTNECLADCDTKGGEQETPTLTAQHRALIVECAQLGHAYAIARTTADEAYIAYQLHLVQGQEAWQIHIEQDAAAIELQTAFYAALNKRRALFSQLKEQTQQA